MASRCPSDVIPVDLSQLVFRAVVSTFLFCAEITISVSLSGDQSQCKLNEFQPSKYVLLELIVNYKSYIFLRFRWILSLIFMINLYLWTFFFTKPISNFMHMVAAYRHVSVKLT